MGGDIHPKRDTLVAIGLFLLVLIGNSSMFAIVSYISSPQHGGYHAYQIMLCYSAVALLCMLPGIRRTRTPMLALPTLRLHSARATLEVGCFCLSFYSLSFLGSSFTLPMHTAINFITPLLAMVATVIVLKEPAHRHTVLALVLGFAGVLLITRPGVIPLSPGVVYVLLAAIGFSFSGILIKLLTRREEGLAIAFRFALLTTLLSLPLGLSHWKMPDIYGAFWLLFIGGIGYLQQTLVVRAIAKVPFTVLIPLHFVQLLFATAFSLALYGKGLDAYTIAGALVILIATLYNGWQNTRQSSATR